MTETRGYPEDLDKLVLEKCFYNTAKSCDKIAEEEYNKCIGQAKKGEIKCKIVKRKTLERYCSSPNKEKEAFCLALTTSTTPTSSTSSTTTTTTTTQNPLLKTQYVVSYGAIGGVIAVLLIGSLICWLCNRRSEKKRKEEEAWNIPGWSSGGTTSDNGSKKSDVETGGPSWDFGWNGASETGKKKGKTQMKTAKSGTKGGTTSTGTKTK